MNCKICQKECKNIFDATILKKYNGNYYYCEHCNFLFVGEPEKWLSEAYKNSIALEDTGIMQRNIAISQNLSIALYILFKGNGKFLDFAGGYGILVRLMRDYGFDFYWKDIYSENLIARGFEGNLNEQYNAITSFESFEHFLEPMQEIEKLAKISATIIFTTELLPSPIPKPNDWWYYALSSGQHICFYSKRTLEIIAEKLNLKYVHFLNLHIFCEKENAKKIKTQYLNSKIVRNIYIKFLRRRLESKTFSDHLKMSER
jgi:hypothetical protein